MDESGQKNLFIVTSVASAELEVKRIFDIALNVVCVFLSMFSKPTGVSRTNTKTTVQSVEKTCSRHANLPKTYLADMRSMHTVFESWLVSTIAVLYVKRLLSRGNLWQQHGRLALEI